MAMIANLSSKRATYKASDFIFDARPPREHDFAKSEKLFGAIYGANQSTIRKSDG